MTHKLESLETFWKYLEFFETITKMMESDEDITIDTGIYEHYNNNCNDFLINSYDNTLLDTNKDIIKIYCKDGSIIFKDIIKAVDKIKKQFKDLQQRCELPKYYFEEIDYNMDTNTYTIIWNIEK